MFKALLLVCLCLLGLLFLLFPNIQIPVDIPTKRQVSKKKVLLYGATPFFGQTLWRTGIEKEWCSPRVAEYCHYTTDSSRSHLADAWLYHNRDFYTGLIEKWNNRHVHVMFTSESPANEGTNFPSDFINWTMTYRRDADIFEPQLTGDSIWRMKDPGLTASWMVSFCRTENKRMELVQKAVYLDLKVDIYGKCGNYTIPGCERSAPDRNDCAAEIHKKYYFYVAFENSNCLDYVTEKFFNALRVFYSIPIVIKRDIYTQLGFPPRSFIALDDFASIQEMVAFLHRLKHNKTEYLAYHEWRNVYNIVTGSYNLGLCGLCEKLSQPRQRAQSYHDFQKWFYQAGCDNKYAYKYLE